jgi:hypothetical protein
MPQYKTPIPTYWDVLTTRVRGDLDRPLPPVREESSFPPPDQRSEAEKREFRMGTLQLLNQGATRMRRDWPGPGPPAPNIARETDPSLVSPKRAAIIRERALQDATRTRRQGPNQTGTMDHWVRSQNPLGAFQGLRYENLFDNLVGEGEPQPSDIIPRHLFENLPPRSGAEAGLTADLSGVPSTVVPEIGRGENPVHGRYGKPKEGSEGASELIQLARSGRIQGTALLHETGHALWAGNRIPKHFRDAWRQLHIEELIKQPVNERAQLPGSAKLSETGRREVIYPGIIYYERDPGHSFAQALGDYGANPTVLRDEHPTIYHFFQGMLDFEYKRSDLAQQWELERAQRARQ